MPTTIGIDIGQQQDPTAIAVAECLEQPAGTQRGGDFDVHWYVRHLERIPLGTPYPQVSERLAEIVYNVGFRQRGVKVYVDATGVGKPVVDLLNDALRGADCRIIPVYFIHGSKRIRNGRAINMGKAYMVSRMQALMQARRLHASRGLPDVHALFDELMNYEIKVDVEGVDRYGAFKPLKHDDLATALGLAVQVDERGVELL